jgi:hypothetical protein
MPQRVKGFLKSGLLIRSLGSKPITTLEIRKSDLPTLQKLRNYNFKAPIAQSQCTDATAELVSLGQGSVCVISGAFTAVEFHGRKIREAD